MAGERGYARSRKSAANGFSSGSWDWKWIGESGSGEAVVEGKLHTVSGWGARDGTVVVRTRDEALLNEPL